jgi:hypothetical protein
MLLSFVSQPGGAHPDHLGLRQVSGGEPVSLERMTRASEEGDDLACAPDGESVYFTLDSSRTNAKRGESGQDRNLGGQARKGHSANGHRGQSGGVALKNKRGEKKEKKKDTKGKKK